MPDEQSPKLSAEEMRGLLGKELECHKLRKALPDEEITRLVASSPFVLARLRPERGYEVGGQVHPRFAKDRPHASRLADDKILKGLHPSVRKVKSPQEAIELLFPAAEVEGTPTPSVEPGAVELEPAPDGGE